MIAKRIWWMRAETSIHIGAGETASLVDLPVIRESTTGYPFAPGSSLKGALRDSFRSANARKIEDLSREDLSDDVQTIFGTQDGAGEVLVSDGRLAFLPLRSLDHAFVWVTCPYAVKRLLRDLDFAGLPPQDLNTFDFLNQIQETDRSVLHPQALLPTDYSHMIVEDQVLQAISGITDHQRDAIANLALPTGLNTGQLVVVSDGLFQFYARRRLPVRSRTRLEPETKTVAHGALWSEESLPPETLLYAIFTPRVPGSKGLEILSAHLEKAKYLQIGGNETVGEGWLRLWGQGGAK